MKEERGVYRPNDSSTVKTLILSALNFSSYSYEIYFGALNFSVFVFWTISSITDVLSNWLFMTHYFREFAEVAMFAE